ncbi:replicative DNA helicase [Helicobacter sp. faydin-H20]|uniref:replicative DNA helicase n=1 Tax=Helicobacter anatolicus TaxID=2905874 RepID=UPI001E59F77A|nr:replicative DNA helicase [Helicobacter anatolicus]MCE3036752.1 replicative DNA helicase [Helicobacter anatolicus]
MAKLDEIAVLNDGNGYYANLERMIISAILFDPSIFEGIVDALESKDFAYPANRHIFDICVNLYKQGNPIDEEIVKNRLNQKIVSENEYVAILAANPIGNLEAYIKELKNISLKRELHALANVLREQSLRGELDSDTILESVEKKIYEISTQTTQKDFRKMSDILESTANMILELKKNGNQIVTGVPTGFTDLDKVTTGFNKGDLVIIGARPSMGKTTLALNMIQNALNHNIGVAMFSLEMPAEQLMLRMLSSLTSISLQQLKIGMLDENEIGKLTNSINYMREKEFFVDDEGALGITQLRSKLRRLKSKNPNIRLAVIDYLQLMKGSGKDRHLEVSEISRGLKVLARELEIPIIALSQLNRSLESRDDKKPILSDLRESGSIEQDADIILFLYRHEVYAKRELEQKITKETEAGKDTLALKAKLRDMLQSESSDALVIVAKNRNGETKDVPLQFSKKVTRFENKASREDMAEEKSYQATKNYDEKNLGESIEMPSRF